MQRENQTSLGATPGAIPELMGIAPQGGPGRQGRQTGDARDARDARDAGDAGDARGRRGRRAVSCGPPRCNSGIDGNPFICPCILGAFFKNWLRPRAVEKWVIDCQQGCLFKKGVFSRNGV